MRLPKKGVLISLGGEENKVKLLEAITKLSEMGLKLYATEQTAEFLHAHGIMSEKVYKIIADKDPGVLPLIESGRVDLIINIPRQKSKSNLRITIVVPATQKLFPITRINVRNCAIRNVARCHKRLRKNPRMHVAGYVIFAFAEENFGMLHADTLAFNRPVSQKRAALFHIYFFRYAFPSYFF